MIKSRAKSFDGWSLIEFLKGRDKLLIAAIGTIAGWVITNSPAYAGIVGAGTELLYALIKYYIKEY